MEITCKYCGNRIAANVLRGTAKCPTCNGVTRIPERAEDGTPVAVKKQTRTVPPLKRVRVERTGDALEIVYRWFDPLVDAGHAMPIGAIVYLMTRPTPVPNLSLLVVALVLICCIEAVRLLNKTVIRIDTDSLSVGHGPIPWFGRKDVPVRDIHQIYCVENRWIVPSRIVTYRVQLRLSDGEAITLVSGFFRSDQARYIEQVIEKHLGIEDRFVDGEMKR